MIEPFTETTTANLMSRPEIRAPHAAEVALSNLTVS